MLYSLTIQKLVEEAYNHDYGHYSFHSYVRYLKNQLIQTSYIMAICGNEGLNA